MRSFTVPPMFWLAGRIAVGFRKPKQPIPGMVLAGEVAAVGKNVTRFEVGDEILASATHGVGTYTDYCCLPEDGAIGRKPADITRDEAPGIPFG